MDYRIVLLLAIVSTWKPLVEGMKRMQSIVLFRELKNCANKENLLGILKSHSINMIGGGRNAISMDFELSQDVDVITKLTAKVEKCNSFAERHKCEFMTNLVFRDGVCKMAEQEDMAWSPITNGFKPKIRCPLAAGTYSASNVTLDPDKFLQLIPNLGINYYIVTVTGFMRKSRILCLVIGGEITKIKV